MSNCSNHKKDLFGESETWMDILGFEGLYEISDSGNVKSYRKNRAVECILLKPTLTHGYKRVCLCKGGKVYYKTIHFLVAQAFIENPKNHTIINHKDGNKLNNNISNLEWCTAAYNIRHAIRTGLISTQDGQKSRKSKLTEIQAKAILLSDETIQSLASRYGVSASTINAIRNGTNWKHLSRTSDCAAHPRKIAGVGNMRQLAQLVGNLHYKSFAEFLDKLTDKLFLDAAKDRAAGRKRLANALEHTANHLFNAHVESEEMWKISKPFMEPQNKKP